VVNWHTLYASRSPVHYSSHPRSSDLHIPGHLGLSQSGYSIGADYFAAPTEHTIRCNYSRPAVMRCFVPTGQPTDCPDYTTNRGWSSLRFLKLADEELVDLIALA